MLIGWPCYRDDKAKAYGREQRIIHDRLPPFCGAERAERTEIPAARQPPVRNTTRGRELPSRRRQRAEGVFGRMKSKLVPILANYNLLLIGNDEYHGELQTHPMDKTRNYEAAYRQAAATCAGREGTKGAPFNISAPGQELLLAEYLAKPGTRIEPMIPRTSKECWCRVACLAQAVKGPYRQQQLLRKLNVSLPQIGLPPSRPVYIRIRRTCWNWLRRAAARAVRGIIETTRQKYPARAQMATTYTRIIPGRVPRVSESLVGEYAATDSFNVTTARRDASMDRLPAGDLRAQFIRHNWDVPVMDTKRDVTEEGLRGIRGWMQRMKLRKDVWARAEANAVIRQATSVLPSRQTGGGPDDEMEFEAVETVVCRLDKNEHCLYRRSLRLHHLRISQHYINDDQTFEVLPWSGSKAARFLRNMYYVWCPFRFKRPTKIAASDLPRAIVRPKNACHDETGLCCQKPGHIHERIIVSTIGLPQHAQDRQFSRGVQVMMQNTGLPDCELWALRDLQQKHRTSRGRLRMIPQWWSR